MMKYLLSLVFTMAAFGQQYDIGADLAYGFYRNGTIYSGVGSAQAGIRNRFGAGIHLGSDFSQYVGGQFSYLYHDGHPFLEAPGVKVDIQGESHAVLLEAFF